MADVGSGGQIRTRGDKVSAGVIRQQRQWVEDLYVETQAVEETVRRARAEHGLKRSTVVRRIAEVREQWAEEAEKERPHRVAQHRKAILRDMRLARRGEEWSAVLGFRRLLAEIDGVRSAEKHEVVVSDERDLTKLSDAELETLRALAAKARKE